MGRRKNVNNKGGTNNNNYKDSDVSDLESIAYSSVAGDFEHLTEDEDGATSCLSIDSFSEQIEYAQDKRIATRLKALDNICHLCKRNYVVELIDKYKLTLCEIIEKSLKRTPEEALRACTLASLLSLQLGVEIEEDFANVLNILRSICTDESAIENLRSVCAQAIGLCVYLSCEQLSMRLDALQTLQTVWSTMKQSTPLHNLFTSALFSWVLLLERCDSNIISSSITNFQPKICHFLDSPVVDVRISAGEALAVLYELAVENISNYSYFPNHQHLREVLGELAIDSSKSRTKRDKKAQKLSFRQINDSIFCNIPPRLQVKFNKREVLNVEGCHNKLFYDSLCQLLHGDLNTQLRQNLILREIFDLGPIVGESNVAVTKEEKAERRNLFDASTKARNMQRSKQRDKKCF